MKAHTEKNRRSFVLLGDQPHTDEHDPLGFDEIVGDLASLILSSRESTPFSLGIEAPWGRGKSTLMSRLCARLSGVDGVTAVTFNAWTADDGGVLEGLVKTVLKQLDSNVLRRALRNEKMIGGLRFTLGIAAGYLGIGSFIDSFWSRVGADPGARNELRRLVEQAVQDWRAEQPQISEGRLLCVFVDDLDRCSPAGVLDVFEAMKLYLDVPGIVFIVGYDEGIVSDLILHQKGYSDGVRSRDYLEKFIQIVYRLPPAVPHRSDALAESLLAASHTAALFGPTERAIVIDGSESNPRKIKRFINGFVLAYGLDPRWQEFEPQTLIRVHLLQMYFRDFAQMLERPAERDPVAQFLAYRDARDALRRGDQAAGVQVGDVLESYGLARPGPREEEDLGALLSRLDENVPLTFTEFAQRDDFLSLVRSIAAAPDWGRLGAALAEGALPLVSPDRDDESLGSYGRLDERRLDGLRILWVDDMPENNMALMRAMEDQGADVTTVTDTASMEAALISIPVDVLISDIARDGKPDEGLRAVEKLVQAKNTLPPLIFYAANITSARQRRAVALEAALTNDRAVVLDLLAQAAATRRGALRAGRSYP